MFFYTLLILATVYHNAPIQHAPPQYNKPIAGISTVVNNAEPEDLQEAIPTKVVKKKKVKKQSIYTNEEISYLERLVEAEATGGDAEAKRNVASVVINRVKSKDFPNKIIEVINQKSQFSPTSDGRIWSVTVTDETRAAVKYVLQNGPTNQGLFFCNSADVKNLQTLQWFSTLEYITTDSIGHSFYK